MNRHVSGFFFLTLAVIAESTSRQGLSFFPCLEHRMWFIDVPVKCLECYENVVLFVCLFCYILSFKQCILWCYLCMSEKDKILNVPFRPSRQNTFTAPFLKSLRAGKSPLTFMSHLCCGQIFFKFFSPHRHSVSFPQRDVHREQIKGKTGFRGLKHALVLHSLGNVK